MSETRPLASTIAPLFLRLILALVFLWAGIGKIVGRTDAPPAQAAILANLGYDNVQERASLSEGDDERIYTEADFAEPVTVKRADMLAALLHKSAHPPISATGSNVQGIWPTWAADGAAPRVIAYAVAVSELLIGLFCLVGFLTRLSGLASAGMMVVAIWLTQIGPAIQSGDTMLGFLPNRDVWNPYDWTTLFFQLSILAIGLALAFAGAGILSLDDSSREVEDEFAEDDYDDAEDDEDEE